MATAAQSIKENHIQPLWLSGVQFKKHTRKHNLKQPEEKATKVTCFFFFPPVRSEQFLWFQLIATFIIFQYLEFLLIKDLSHCICQFPAPQKEEKERKKRSVSKANRQCKKGQIFLFYTRVKEEEKKKKENEQRLLPCSVEMTKTYNHIKSTAALCCWWTLSWYCPVIKPRLLTWGQQ